MIEQKRVWEALSTVRDPELDEPVTDLGFVEQVGVGEWSVDVSLRLPTYFCAPNFAFIMAADAKRAIESLDGIEEVHVTLVDHHASDEINSGLAANLDFDESFPGEAAGGLEQVRDVFRRKAFIARQEQLLRTLPPTSDPARLEIGDLPAGPETDLYLKRRAELGIDINARAPFLVTPEGKPIPADMLSAHLRFAHTVAVSIEGNASFCKGLLQTRYATREGAIT
jgi:metal-sulfur cluster biosynthetic enzyme